MADVFSKEKRSAIMAKVKGSGNLTTEMKLAQILRESRVNGWRRNWKVFGKPDFAFPKAKLAVFVDGCFWHGCPKCYTTPTTNVAFWLRKIERNRKRDLKVKAELRKRGWTILRFWECQLKDAKKISRRIQRTLANRPKTRPNLSYRRVRRDVSKSVSTRVEKSPSTLWKSSLV